MYDLETDFATELNTLVQKARDEGTQGLKGESNRVRLIASARGDEELALYYLKWGQALLADWRPDEARRCLELASKQTNSISVRGRAKASLADCCLRIGDREAALVAAKGAMHDLAKYITMDHLPHGEEDLPWIYQNARDLAKRVQDQLDLANEVSWYARQWRKIAAWWTQDDEAATDEDLVYPRSKW